MMIDENADPYGLFKEWFVEAEKTESVDPNAMTIASVDAAGMPNARTVLLKAWSKAGFVFYTNLESAKGEELRSQKMAAMLFHWKTQKRQVRAQGVVDLVSEDVADRYFASRPRQSQLGAWASAQSQPLDSRETFEARLEHFANRFEGSDILRPAHWSGFQLAPTNMEFWQDREFRLHDRVRYTRQNDAWVGVRLYP